MKLLHAIVLLRVESCHWDARQLLIAEGLGLPPVEYCFALVWLHVHHRSATQFLVWRKQTVDVALLHDRTNLLVFLDCLLAECLLFLRHVLWLNFHTETSTHSHIDAEFQRNGAESLVVRSCTDMRSHRHGREEIAGSPLHVDALECVGIIAHPELIEVRQNAIVGTSSTTGTSLNNHLWILRTNALAHLLESSVVFDVKVTLAVFGEILRTMVHHRCVGIPLNIIKLRIVGEEGIHNVENEVLHLWIAHVEHQLSATTSLHWLTVGGCNDIFWVLLVEFALRISHFRLNPNTKFDVVLLGCIDESLNAMRQLACINRPVSERVGVVVAMVFHAKPSIVHHKEFSTHAADVVHHLVHALFVDVEIDTFPTVQQDWTQFGAMSNLVGASPTVEMTTCTAQSFVAVSECQSRSHKAFTALQIIL